MARVCGVFQSWGECAGIAVGIIGVAVGAYFYYAGKHYPYLVYDVSPTRSIVVKQGATSRLAIYYDEERVEKDVTTAEVSFVNQGKDPIRRAGILRPLTVHIGDHARILEATVKSASREVAGIRLDDAQKASGELVLTWDILEKDDGAQLQIVYIGDDRLPIICSGVFEGQSSIARVERQDHQARNVFLAVFISSLASMALSSIIRKVVMRRYYKKLHRRQNGLVA